MREVSIPQVERCRKCEGYVLVTYHFEGGEQIGWSVKELQVCGRPLMCGEKVRGLELDPVVRALGGAR